MAWTLWESTTSALPLALRHCRKVLPPCKRHATIVSQLSALPLLGGRNCGFTRPCCMLTSTALHFVKLHGTYRLLTTTHKLQQFCSIAKTKHLTWRRTGLPHSPSTIWGSELVQGETSPTRLPGGWLRPSPCRLVTGLRILCRGVCASPRSHQEADEHDGPCKFG